MLMVLIAGLVTGFVISAPVGPMAALAALDVSLGRRAAAIAVMLGVCAGDMLLAAVSAGLLNIDINLPLPHWLPVFVAVAVLLVMAVWVWLEAGKQVKTVEGYKSFWSAVAVTLVNPGNVAAYLALYSAVLPHIGMKTVEDLTMAETLLLLGASGLGMLAGWVLFLGAIAVAVERFGNASERLRPMMAKGVSVLMVVAAVALVWAAVR